MHGRMARYTYTGDAQELARVAEEGILPIFQGIPGFKAYTIAANDDRPDDTTQKIAGGIHLTSARQRLSRGLSHGKVHFSSGPEPAGSGCTVASDSRPLHSARDDFPRRPPHDTDLVFRWRDGSGRELRFRRTGAGAR